MTVTELIENGIICLPDINEINSALLNNDPIEEKLNVIMVISNPCNFKKRYKLAKEFISRMSITADVELFIVELAYGEQCFRITKKDDPNHLQLRCSVPLWHKENMINIGVEKLLPKGWKAFAWIDADIEFENIRWASDTLKILNGCRDVVQVFGHCIDMDARGQALSIFPSFGFQFCKGAKYGGTGINMWHPGYGWACTRKAYERMGGLYELSILGAGDHNMSFSFVGESIKSLNLLTTKEYKKSVADFQCRALGLRLGYVPGMVRHFYHGSKGNRRYSERWQVLVTNAYDPFKHVTKNEDGLLIPTDACPKAMLEQIMEYFEGRNEDE